MIWTKISRTDPFPAPVGFKTLPVSFIDQDRQDASTFMQDLTPEDLLQRDPVIFEEMPRVEGRAAVVTGAAGSIGSEICVQLARYGIDKLVLVDVNENGMYMLKLRLDRERPDTTVLIDVGDIRDPGRMRAIFHRHRPHDVFHAAAHKHVPLMEAAPCEAVKNNVLGTRNVAEAADGAGVKRFIYISTDKAVRPSSVMGACKRLGEQVVRAIADRSMTKFRAVRFGNVLGSAGSVVSVFEVYRLVEPIEATVANIQRYTWTSIAIGIGLLSLFIVTLIIVNGRALTRRRRLSSGRRARSMARPAKKGRAERVRLSLPV